MEPMAVVSMHPLMRIHPHATSVMYHELFAIRDYHGLCLLRAHRFHGLAIFTAMRIDAEVFRVLSDRILDRFSDLIQRVAVGSGHRRRGEGREGSGRYRNHAQMGFLNH